MDLVKIDRQVGFVSDQRIVLEGAHNGEIVRSLYIDDQASVS
jgi:hypothetical protein